MSGGQGPAGVGPFPPFRGHGGPDPGEGPPPWGAALSPKPVVGPQKIVGPLAGKRPGAAPGRVGPQKGRGVSLLIGPRGEDPTRRKMLSLKVGGSCPISPGAGPMVPSSPGQILHARVGRVVKWARNLFDLPKPCPEKRPARLCGGGPGSALNPEAAGPIFPPRPGGCVGSVFGRSGIVDLGGRRPKNIAFLWGNQYWEKEDSLRGLALGRIPPSSVKATPRYVN